MDAAPWEIRLLGSMEVWRGGQLVELPATRARAVLALLALEANRPVRVERIVDALWDDPPRTAVSAVQVYVSALRRCLRSSRAPGGRSSEEIRTVPRGYLLDVPDSTVDVDQFNRQVEQGRDKLLLGDPESGLILLDQALGLWRGAALGEFTGMPFAVAQGERLEADRLEALSLEAEASLATGAAPALVPRLIELVRRHPLHEGLRLQLMLAFYRSGQQSAALASYAEARSALAEAMGVDPGPELRQLYDRILHHDPCLEAVHPDLTAGRVRPSSPDRQPAVGPLPSPLTPLVGREELLQHVVSLLRSRSVRLVNLTGPGGTGKTRVALEAARRLAADFVNGVAFVGLAAVEDPRQVMTEILLSLGGAEAPEEPPMTTLLHHLGHHRVLVVLDNVEQVAESGADLVALLEQAPGLAVLLTSRRALRMAEETVVLVPPLDVTELSVADHSSLSSWRARVQASGAVQLFRQRAEAASSRRLDDDDLQAVAQICCQLNGLPLALELAAARTTVLTPRAMLPRLENSLSLLASSSPGLPSRQCSMQATLQWSWELLRPDDAIALEELAQLSGSWTMDAAERVCGTGPVEALDTVTRLVDASLVTATAAGRFCMLYVVREFGRERLRSRGAGAAAALDRFLSWAVDLATELDDCYWSHGLMTRDLRARWELDCANLTAALEEADGSGRGSALVAIVAALGRFWYLTDRGRQGAQWIERALHHRVPGSDRADLLRVAGGTAFTARGLPVLAERYQREALQIYEEEGDAERARMARYNLAQVVRWQGRFDEAKSLFEQVHLEAQSMQPRGLQTLETAGALAEVYDEVDEAERGIPLVEDYLEAATLAGSLEHLAYACADTALLRQATGRDGHRSFLVDALAYCRHAESSIACRVDVFELVALVEIADGHFASAQALLLESINLMAKTGYPLLLADAVTALAVCAARVEAGDLGRAAVLLGVAAGLRARTGVAMMYRPLRVAHATTLEALESDLETPTFTMRWDEGLAASSSESAIFAVALGN